MLSEKKQLEILLMKYFRESYADFPKGRIVSSESPDFLLKMKSNLSIGIELTRLNPINVSIPEFSGEYNEVIIDELISDTRDIFEANSDLKLFVKFLFSQKVKILPERKIAISAKMAVDIKKAIQNRKRESFFKIKLKGSQLPNGIDEILIIHHPELKISVWERSNKFGLSNYVIDDIRQSIVKKEEKLAIYQKQRLDYYWLVISVDRLRGIKGNLYNKIINYPFRSSFHHVFLFDLFKSQTFSLV